VVTKDENIRPHPLEREAHLSSTSPLGWRRHRAAPLRWRVRLGRRSRFSRRDHARQSSGRRRELSHGRRRARVRLQGAEACGGRVTGSGQRLGFDAGPVERRPPRLNAGGTRRRPHDRRRPKGSSDMRTLIGLAVMLAVLAPPRPGTAGLAKSCRKLCKPMVATCVAGGERRRACRRSILARCRQEGLQVCSATTNAIGVGPGVAPVRLSHGAARDQPDARQYETRPRMVARGGRSVTSAKPASRMRAGIRCWSSKWAR
jgi:hypothetical protein